MTVDLLLCLGAFGATLTLVSVESPPYTHTPLADHWIDNEYS